MLSAVVKFKSGTISACIVILMAYPPVTRRDFFAIFWAYGSFNNRLAVSHEFYAFQMLRRDFGSQFVCFGSVLFDRACSNSCFSSPIGMLTFYPPEKRKTERNKLTNVKRSKGPKPSLQLDSGSEEGGERLFRVFERSTESGEIAARNQSKNLINVKCLSPGASASLFWLGSAFSQQCKVAFSSINHISLCRTFATINSTRAAATSEKADLCWWYRRWPPLYLHWWISEGFDQILQWQPWVQILQRRVRMVQDDVFQARPRLSYGGPLSL